ncbi:MAG: signal peptide peptidase SppA [Planctomycetes bacterium]|nr:signal peptide peptidase SppA [Planctomycetota bacterium]
MALLVLALVVSLGLNVGLFFGRMELGVGMESGLSTARPKKRMSEVTVESPKAATRDKIVHIDLDGIISSVEMSGLFSDAMPSMSSIKHALEQAVEDKNVKAVVLRINSPGGEVTASDILYNAVKKAAKEKPVVVYMDSMAASGGYYVAVAAERITARRTTITGSIGVIMSAWNFAEAAKKLGIDQIAIKSDRTPFKDILSPTRPMRDEERAMLTGIVDELYDQFVSVVDEGRKNLDRAQVLAAATGAVYTAGQARDLGLIDEIGDLESVREWFVSQLGGDVEIVEMRRRPGLGELLFGGVPGVTAPQPDLAQRLLLNSTGPRFLYFWQGGR